MSFQTKLFSRKPRRPRPGTGFLLIRLAGWFLKIVGGLLIISALISFIAMLVKMGPTLVEALQFPEQEMAGFIILITGGGLLLFVLLGLAGAISLGLGIVFGYWGTEPIGASLSQLTTASTPA